MSRTPSEAYIVDAVRTPIGRRNGGLADVHPADLAAHALKGLIDRTGVDPSVVDDVIMGCVAQVGSQAWNVARTSWLSAGFPEHVPGVTIDRQCGSSQQAVHFAAQAVMSGTQDLVVAAGVESMTIVGLNTSADVGAQIGARQPFDGEGWSARYGQEEIHQLRSAELVAQKWGISRREMEEFALESHRRAAEARHEGRFEPEIIPHPRLAQDECIRETSLEKMASLPPVRDEGQITAALASQVADGSAAVLVASAAAVERHGLRPRARIVEMSVVGGDPLLMLTGPIDATHRLLERAGMSVGDIDLFECNEAFAPVVIAWARETSASLDLTNVNGGAIALGHPLGASGSRLLCTLLSELERRGGRYGLQVMCEGGGLSNATLIERLD